MNIWFFFLYYIYSGIALGGLCAGKANELTAGLYNTDTDDAEAEPRRRQSQDRITQIAFDIGNQMAHNSTANLVGSYNASLIDAYEKAQELNRQQAAQQPTLSVVPPARGD